MIDMSESRKCITMSVIHPDGGVIDQPTNWNIIHIGHDKYIIVNM